MVPQAFLKEYSVFKNWNKDKPVTYCSETDLIWCLPTVESAWEQCKSTVPTDDVIECIENILEDTEYSDCIMCICDIIGCK